MLLSLLLGREKPTAGLGSGLSPAVPGAGGGVASTRALASENGARPQCKGSVTGDGVTSVKFTKKSYTGVMVYCRRGIESQFTLLSKQLTSPLVDGRANLQGGLPETREYKAQFFRNDSTVGQMSDILVLTVPASGAAKPAESGNATALKAAA